MNLTADLPSTQDQDFFSCFQSFFEGAINEMINTPRTQSSSSSIFSSNTSINLTGDLPSSQEEDFFSFQPFLDGAIDEMNDTPRSQSSTASTAFSNNPTKKRGRNYEQDQQVQSKETEKEGLKEMPASVLLIDDDEEELAYLQEFLKSSNEEHSDLQDCHSELDNADRVNVKKFRLSASGGSRLEFQEGAGAQAGRPLDPPLLSAASKEVPAVPLSAESNETSGGGSQLTRVWVKNRSTAWWDKCNHPDFPESKFREAFRMSRATFNMICEELKSEVAKKDTMLRTAIPVQQRVAVCIWRLATGESLQLVSKRFGLGTSTCHKLVLEVCSAIKTVLMPKYVQLPDAKERDRFQNSFENISGIPNVVGSMYTTHISIIAPKVSGSTYCNPRHTERNQKASYSITVQGVVNPEGIFRDVCIGWPGSLTDDQVLENSTLHMRAIEGQLKDVWIVGSSSYPLMDWVLVPYTNHHLTRTQLNFNGKIKEIQSVAKEAFARLKGRWSFLQKRTEVKLQDLPMVIGACCALHNICEMRNDVMNPKLAYHLIDDEMVPEINMRSENALRARDAIAYNLLYLAHPAFL